MRLPIRSWRKPGVKNIFAIAPKYDPAFDVAGLPTPFSVYFPVFITNLYTQIIYVTALLVSPPAGWTDTEQNVTAIGVGANARVEKSNATRSMPSTPLNETITVRWNYRTGSYAGPIIGFDDFPMTVYWEDITTGTIDNTDDFESPCNPNPPYDCDGWIKTDLIGTCVMERRTDYVAHGAYSIRLHPNYVPGNACYISQALTMGSGSRAYIFGYMLILSGTYVRVEVVSPIETLYVVCQAAATWRRWGVRLNPGVLNEVRIYTRFIWGTDYVYLDYLRWVRF